MNVREAQAASILDYSGQSDFYNPVYHGGSVSVVGAGGIGSGVILGLARLGIPLITIYDDDNVEPHNVSAQNYEIDQVGLNKAEAIASSARKVSVANIKAYPNRITAESLELGNRLPGDIAISAVDSMKSRKEIFEAARKSSTVRYLIDGRLGGELIVCHVINIRDKDHVDYYLSEDVMFDDSEVVSNACTSRAVCDVGFAVSALIVRAVRRILTNKPTERQQIFNMSNLRMDVS